MLPSTLSHGLREPSVSFAGWSRRVIATAAGLFALGGVTPLPAAPIPAPERMVLFKAGEGKYPLFRAPQIYVTKAGTILAFGQGRMAHHDQSSNDILGKRSVDGGRTWSPLTLVADSGEDTLNSVCVVQVKETGRIIVMGGIIPYGYQHSEFEYFSPERQAYERKEGREKMPGIRPGYEGKDIARGYVVTSDDDGVTWSPLVDITRAIKPPPPYLWVMPGPGIAIQLKAGRYAGRIVVPCYTRWLETSEKPFKYSMSPYMVYSDDQGKTWQRGEILFPNPNRKAVNENECQVVEAEDGSLLLNTRSGGANGEFGKGRKTARSTDGGKTWHDIQMDPHLDTFGTAAGFFRYSSPRDGEKNRILFSNPVHKGRTEGRIWLSYDEGRNWTYKVLEPGRFGYSTMARLPDNRIGCIFWGEEGNVDLMTFTLEWLTDGKDRP